MLVMVLDGAFYKTYEKRGDYLVSFKNFIKILHFANKGKKLNLLEAFEIKNEFPGHPTHKPMCQHFRFPPF